MGSPSPDEIENLAEIKAARDLLVHSRGVVNPTYLSKAGAKARFAENDRLEITEPYLRETWLLIRKVVDETSAAAIAKLENTTA